MLWEELNDSDILHCTYIRGRVIETWERYIQTLSGELEVCFCSPVFSYSNVISACHG